MGMRVAGIALFLPVPLVLWLFSFTPLGIPLSLTAGVLVMLTHPLYARPFALERKTRRCLWCGRETRDGTLLTVAEPQGETTWRVCCADHESRLRRFLGWAGRGRWLLRGAILGGLALLLVVTPLAGTGRLAPLVPGDGITSFKLLVALVVFPLGLLGPVAGPPSPGALRVPFPVHIQSLIGTCAITWLFRIVGAIWLLRSSIYVAQRLEIG